MELDNLFGVNNKTLIKGLQGIDDNRAFQIECQSNLKLIRV